MSIVFETAGFSVVTYGDAYGALEALEDPESPDVLIVDLGMPGMDGRRFVREVQGRRIDSRILIASGMESQEAAVELGADGAIAKPFDVEILVAAVSHLCEPTSSFEV